MNSLCTPGEPSRMITVSITDPNGISLNKQTWEVPEMVRFATIRFNRSPKSDPHSDTMMDFGVANPNEVQKASGKES